MMVFNRHRLLLRLIFMNLGFLLVKGTELQTNISVDNTNSLKFDENCSQVNENTKNTNTELEQISQLLNTLIELQTKSTNLESAIKQQGREIKMNILPDGYDKRTAPPRINDTIPNEIMVTIDIFSIPHLDEKLEEIMIEIRVTHFWMDTRLLTANLIDGQVELEPAAIADLWTPDSYFHHTKESRFIRLMTPTASLTIYSNKTIRYSTMLMLTVGCPMKFHNYPMDQQTCRIQLQSFGYDIAYNTYRWRRPPHIHKDINLDNHEVNIKEYTFTYKSGEGEIFPGLGVKINLKRHIGFHLTLTYIPSIIFVLVAWLSFLVPSDIVPGRMVLCVTTLLTLTSMFNSVRSLTPQVSYMKAIDSWVFVCMLFVFSSLAEYGLILHLTSRSGWQKRVDQHIKSMTGASRLSVFSPAKLISLTINNDQENDKKSNTNEILDANTEEFKELHKRSKIFPPTFEKGNIVVGRDNQLSGEFPGDQNTNIKTTKYKNVNTSDIDTKKNSASPTKKERWAYAIEFSSKIIYLVSFLIYNIVYWTSYYGV